MTENSSARRNRSLYFLVGVLAAVVGVFAFMVVDEQIGRGGTEKLELTIDAPKT